MIIIFVHFLMHILEYACDYKTLAEVLRRSQEEKEDMVTQKRHMKIFDRQFPPSPPPQKERRISSNVFLTPTKHK